MLLGLRHGLEADADGLPVVVAKGRDLLRRLEGFQGTSACREIRGDARLPLRCIGVVREAPALCAQSLCSDCSNAIAADQRQTYARLVAHWAGNEFHCARTVLRHVLGRTPVDDRVLDSASAFMGGTVFTGRTCSALTAGVMALGLELGEIENSRLRVLRMIATMAVGGKAFENRLNAFNKTMNLGHDLALWFAAEFGSTQCCEITQCDFSTADGVTSYIDGRRCDTCRTIAQSVAKKVTGMIDSHACPGRE
jgi:hypothetical protein